MITTHIQPEPQQPSLCETGIDSHAADDPQVHDKDGSTTGDESDQDSKTSEDDTMIADEEHNGKPPHSSMCSLHSVRTQTYTDLEVTKLVTINKTHLTVDAVPSHQGCVHQNNFPWPPPH